jgi:hypothetical protein
MERRLFELCDSPQALCSLAMGGPQKSDAADGAISDIAGHWEFPQNMH